VAPYRADGACKLYDYRDRSGEGDQVEDIGGPNFVDILALVAVIVGAVQGWIRRLSGEIASLISTVAALVLGITLCRPLGEWLVVHTRLTERPAALVAFLATIIAATAVMILIRFLLRSIMKVVFEETTDRIGGCVAGILRVSAIVLIVFLAMNLWPHEYLNRIFGEESTVGSVVVRYVPLGR